MLILKGNQGVYVCFWMMYKSYAIMCYYTRKAIYFSSVLRYNTLEVGEIEK